MPAFLSVSCKLRGQYIVWLSALSGMGHGRMTAFRSCSLVPFHEIRQGNDNMMMMIKFFCKLIKNTLSQSISNCVENICKSSIDVRFPISVNNQSMNWSPIDANWFNWKQNMWSPLLCPFIHLCFWENCTLGVSLCMIFHVISRLANV